MISPRLAALGALAASVGLLVAFLGFLWLVAPRFTGGIDTDHAAVAGIAVGFVFAVLIAVHLVYAKVLWTEAVGRRA